MAAQVTSVGHKPTPHCYPALRAVFRRRAARHRSRFWVRLRRPPPAFRRSRCLGHLRGRNTRDTRLFKLPGRAPPTCRLDSVGSSLRAALASSGRPPLVAGLRGRGPAGSPPARPESPRPAAAFAASYAARPAAGGR